MGITLDDLNAQRAMLKRGEEKRKADWKQAERERLRDTFAAAALTGLLSHQKCHYADDIDEPARDAYAYADAMLRERNGAVAGCETVRLTDEEREAIAWAIDALVGIEDFSPGAVSADASAAATLRKLLERLR